MSDQLLSSSPATSSSQDTQSSSADSLERPSSTPIGFPSDIQPPTGPKAWRERQHSHRNASTPTSPALSAAVPKLPPQHPSSHVRHQPAGIHGGRPFSPHLPHRQFLPQHQQQPARSFNTSHRPQGPWRHGDPIVFSNSNGGARAALPQHQNQNLQQRRNASRTVSAAETVTAPKKRVRKPKASEAGSSEQHLARIRGLSKATQGNLKDLEMEVARLLLQPQDHGVPDGIEALQLAVEIMQTAELVVATAKKAKEAIEEEELRRQEEQERLKTEAEDIAQEDPHVPLEFQIPEAIMEEKLKLDDNDAAKFWSHTDYTDGNGRKVAVYYCKTIAECEKQLERYLDDKVVGFDMEWCEWASSRSARQNVAMIQIANESAVTLCHIGQMELPPEDADDETKLISPTLRKIIESETILKVGVYITNDSRRLRDYLFLKPRNIFELSDLHNLVHCAENSIATIPRRLVALARLTEIYLHLPLDKGPVRTSRWDKPITAVQAKYAAADAYVGLRIFDILDAKRRALNPRPPLPPARIIDDLPAPVPAPRGRKSSSTAADVDTANLASALAGTTLSDSSSSSSATKKTSNSSIPPAPEFQQAAMWLENFQKGNPNAKSQKSQLRAYALWHEFGQDVDTVCRIWRDPPLKVSTVTSYIAEAIRLDKLPFERERLKEVLALMSPMIKMKYVHLLKDGTETEKPKTVRLD